jgi:predicted RecA/RadA family phage recombinase
VALNEIFKEGNHLSAPVADTVRAGDPLRIGILNAVAETDPGGTTNNAYVVNGVAQPTGGIGNAVGNTSVSHVGVWRVPVAGALAGYGTPVYIKADGTLTATATGNFLWGTAIRQKGTGTGDAIVRIAQPYQITASA